MKRRALFLDLQGTLGGTGLDDIRGFSFYPCAASAVRLLNEHQFLTVVVTNQSNIAKGEFTAEYFWKRIGELRRQLQEEGAQIDAVYCCPHASDGDCACRKPLPGLLRQASSELGCELDASYIVGDAGWDIAMKRHVPCRAILVKTGLGVSSWTDYRHTWADIDPDFIASTVLDAVHWILLEESMK